jgi:hypothetical protein
MTPRKKPAPLTALPSPTWPPQMPADIVGDGAALWDSVVSRYRLNDAEIITLANACRTLSLVEDLQASLDEHGPVITQPSGRLAANPAASEIRQQRLTAARLIASLRLPTSDGRSAAKPLRGVYTGVKNG